MIHGMKDQLFQSANDERSTLSLLRSLCGWKEAIIRAKDHESYLTYSGFLVRYAAFSQRKRYLVWLVEWSFSVL